MSSASNSKSGIGTISQDADVQLADGEIVTAATATAAAAATATAGSHCRHPHDSGGGRGIISGVDWRGGRSRRSACVYGV
jgi:hypothetical protein